MRRRRAASIEYSRSVAHRLDPSVSRSRHFELEARDQWRGHHLWTAAVENHCSARRARDVEGRFVPPDGKENPGKLARQRYRRDATPTALLHLVRPDL
jgi:hypothetical protein